MRSHTHRVMGAIAILLTLSATAVVAQFGTFNPAFDGELWGVRHELTPGGGAVPAGVAFVNGTLFVADSANQTILAYDDAGQIILKPGADWDTADPLSPVTGLVPNQLAHVVVAINGVDTDTLFVSDDTSNRVAAFDANGAYLFTLRLQRPIPTPTVKLSIGEMAMSPGAKFHLTTATSTLTLTGSFAAAWVEQLVSGEANSGVLAYLGVAATFPFSGDEFLAAPTAIRTGRESDPTAPNAWNMFGVTFDTAANLYILDAFTERLNVYDANLSHLFTFGTPVADGTTAEFLEPWGLTFVPDGAGTSGRLFINDTYNNRILIYRPVDGPDADTVIDGLQYESVIEHFFAPETPIELFSIAFDASSGRLALTDFALPRVVVLQQPGLATFDVQVLGANGDPASSVCTAAPYQVRFSLTVPSGRPAVTGVVPQLSLDGVAAGSAPVPADVYPSDTLQAGNVVTYTYTVTAPATAGADIHAIAGASATNTADILMRAETIALSDCAGETDPSTITATPSTPPQLSGWTPLFEGDTFSVMLAAQDDNGIDSIEYELHGANNTGDDAVAVSFDGIVTDAITTVPIVDPGRTTLLYRVRDATGIWSPWQSLDVRTKAVVNRETNENVATEFRVGDPEGVGFSYSVEGLPAGMTFSAQTGQFAGVMSFDAHDPYSTNPAVASGIYHVVVTEHASNGDTSSVAFTWTVNHVNREPIITNQPVVGLTIAQGQLFELKINGADPDGDPVIFTMHGTGSNGQALPSAITIDAVTGQISGIFPVDADNDYDIVVGLAECGEQLPDPPCNVAVLPGSHLATFFGFNLAVLDANLPPDIVSPGAQTSAEGAIVSLPIQFSDAEGDTLTFEASGLPGGLSIDAATGVISGTVAYGEAGPHAVTVQVDDHFNTPKRSVTFDWTITHTNRPPVVTIPDRVSVEGDVIPNGASLAPYAVDPDGSPVTFVSVSGLPPGVALAMNGSLVGAFDYVSAGSYTVNVRVTDGADGTDATFLWTVYNLNRAPTLDPVNQFNIEGDTVSYLVASGDPDGDALSFSINGLPHGLTLDTSTGLISGLLTHDSIGVYQVNIAVADLVPDSRSVLKSFTWTVSKINFPPLVTPMPNRVNAENDSVILPVIAVDPDGDLNLQYSAANLPPGLSINASTGVITGTVTYNAAGSYNVSITVSDGKGPSGVSTITFRWDVTNLNRAPKANDDVATVVQGASVAINVRGNDADADGDALTVVGVTTPTSGSAVINANGTITFTASSATFVGVSTFSYTISDGAATSTALVSVTVTASNRPPVCTAATASPSLLWPPNHKEISITVGGVTDPDGGTPAIKFTSILQDEPIDSEGQGHTPMQDGGIESRGTRAWVRAERSGTGDGRFYILAFTATDTTGASCSGTVTVGVPHDQGKAPVLSPGRWNSLTGQLVTPPPPIANDDAITVAKNRQRVIAVLADDVVVGPVTVTIVSPPSKGTATVNTNGTITYTASSAAGTTSFSYRIATAGGSDIAVVSVTIANKVNDDNCGDPNHDHDRDTDSRERDHRQGNHMRCRHPK